MAHGMGRPLDVPQHTAHKAHNSQDARLNPYLKIEVMGVNKGRLSVIQVEIINVRLHRGLELDDIGLDRRCAQAGAGDRRLFDDLQRRLV